jgi:hypothetical protein
MPIQKHRHILLIDKKKTKAYSPKRRKIDLPADAPFLDQRTHGAVLDLAYRNALQAMTDRCEALGINPAQADKGAVVEFSFRDDRFINVGSFENAQGKKIEVLNVKMNEAGRPESILVYIPPGRTDFIKKQIGAYTDPTKNRTSGPQNYKKYDKTQSINAVTVSSFWIDKLPIPAALNQNFTWEIWLREGTYQNFKEKADQMNGVTVSEHHLQFPEREICSAHCSLADIEKLELLTKAITGFRFLPTQSGFFDSMPPGEQQGWQENLSGRIVIAANAQSSVCILDTGLNVDHPLIRPAIAANGTDTCKPEWGADDHHGHGTEMAGIALFGDLTPVLEGTGNVEINHYIESVKVFPRNGQNSNDHVGYITTQAVARAEINNPDLNRIFCLSWSIEHELQKNGVAVTEGKPTPLSAKLDQLAFGVDNVDEWRIDDDRKRLLVVSAGNIKDAFNANQYPNINDLSEIEDPGQAWNVLTVGACTDKTFTNDPTYNGWSIVANSGQLSPKSRTSVLWGSTYWPTKPDIVLEGGNYLANASQYMESHPDICPLTTDKDRVFCFTKDTSAANAEASRLAAVVSSQYQDFWPETLRGILVHSAQWTEGMEQNANLTNKAGKISLLRRCGYGVPNTEVLVNSLSNRPCVIIQDYLRPFKKSTKGPNIIFGDMNHYVLPWPKEQLNQIYDKTVKLRVTLSYFIEPSPSERPPKTKYSYASHELRFKLNKPNEEENVFLSRINNELQLEELNEELADEFGMAIVDDDPVTVQDKWVLGPETRDRGGVISDVWVGTGAELATQNLLAIVPQQGWWKHRSKFPSEEKARYNQQIRYSLIISLISDEDIDLYTPIYNQVFTPVTIQT